MLTIVVAVVEIIWEYCYPRGNDTTHNNPKAIASLV